MKHISKLSLSILASLMLAACSSGGGGNHSSSVPNKSEVTSKKEVTPATKHEQAKSNTSEQLAVNKTGTGAVYIVSGQDSKKKVSYKVLDNADNLNLIVVDGKTIRVAHQDVGIFSATWAKIQGSASCCGKFSDVKFGAKGSYGPEDNDYLFYNGHPTKNMPTAGVASYTGYFVIAGNEYKQFDEEDYLFGSAKFNVDFANKKLKGSLEEKSLKPISIEAKIDGNSFVGEAKSSDFGSKAKVEGKFFGDKAKELGGLFKDGKNSWGGAFGAAQ